MAWLGGTCKGRSSTQGSDGVRTFELQLQQRVNALSQQFHGTPTVAALTPTKYTVALFGVEYLLNQQAQQLCHKTEDFNKEIDEGFGDEDIDMTEQEFASALEEAVDTAFITTRRGRGSVPWPLVKMTTDSCKLT